MNIGRKIITYSKAVGLSALIGLSGCAKKESHVPMQDVVNEASSSTTKLLSMLERGDIYSKKLRGVPKSQRILTVDEISKYAPNDSLGELFYQVYVGAADASIRKSQGKKANLVTVGQGITGSGCIQLAGGAKAYEGDYINAHSVDSIMNIAVNRRDNIIKSNVSDSVYDRLVQNEKDAIISYLYNVDPKLLIKNPKGKSFFQYLNEGNKGMVQAKFNISTDTENAAAGLAKRNIVQLLIFGDGKVYKNKEAQENFKKQVKIVRSNKHGESLLKEAMDIVKRYGVNSENIENTEKMIFPKN